MIEKEIWKTLIYRGMPIQRLEISNYGRIRNKNTGKILKLTENHKGYLGFCTSIETNKKIYVRVHKAVAENFVDNPQNLPFVNHIDGDKKNNRSTNLEYCTNRNNSEHSIIVGLYNPYHNPNVCKKIYCVENNMIYESITEAARTCQIFSVSIESARKNISRALRQNQKAYGKTWKYLEDKVDARE